jgi:hypothetical protein
VYRTAQDCGSQLAESSREMMDNGKELLDRGKTLANDTREFFDRSIRRASHV